MDEPSSHHRVVSPYPEGTLTPQEAPSLLGALTVGLSGWRVFDGTFAVHLIAFLRSLQFAPRLASPLQALLGHRRIESGPESAPLYHQAL
jgi:hypothetical protein